MVAKDNHLNTVGQVLDVLGVERARKLAKVKARDAHYMWLNRKAFPPRSYAAFRAALEDAGYTARLSLWRQLPPD